MFIYTIYGKCKVFKFDSSDYHYDDHDYNAPSFIKDLLVDKNNENIEKWIWESDSIYGKIDSLWTGIELIDGELNVVSRAVCSDYLSNEDFVDLINYCQGQWSDGWGEGYEQNDSKVENIYVSPWYREQIVNAKFTEV